MNPLRIRPAADFVILDGWPTGQQPVHQAYFVRFRGDLAVQFGLVKQGEHFTHTGAGLSAHRDKVISSEGRPDVSEPVQVQTKVLANGLALVRDVVGHDGLM